jgi:peptidyl-prolyl cis-trans isomerase C
MRKKILGIFLVVFVLSGCENIPFLQGRSKKPLKPKPPTGEIVAVIGDFYVTSQDMDKQIEDYNAVAVAQGINQGKIDTREKKVSYLRNELVRKYILYREALDRGLDKNTDIKRELESSKMNILVTELVKAELNKIEVSSKEIEDFYNKNKDLLKEPEQRRVLEIVNPLEAEAKQAYIQLLQGGDFAALAKQYSKAQTAGNGGDLGFITLELDPKKRIRFDKFYEVVFAASLEAGGISSIFKGPEGYYIIKLDSIKKSETKPLSELWDNIKSWLLFEKQQNTISELANKLAGETKVEIYEDKVS